MSEGGRTPALTLHQLTNLGFGFVIYPTTMLRIASRVFGTFLTDLEAEGTSEGWAERMHGLDGLNAVVGLDEFLAIDQRFQDFSLTRSASEGTQPRT